jgi:DNA-binding MarR family transcriptional regulator
MGNSQAADLIEVIFNVFRNSGFWAFRVFQPFIAAPFSRQQELVMSIRLIEQVWGLKLNNEGERLVLLALADNANDEGTHCFPSQRRIAWKTDLSVSAIKAIINRLEIKGLVETLNKGNQYRPTNYALHLEKGEIKEAFVPSSWGGDRNDPTAHATGKALEREQYYRDTAGKVKGQLENLQSESPAQERLDHRSEGLVRESGGLVHGSEGLGTTHEPSVQPSVEPSVQPETLTVAVPDMAGKGSVTPFYALKQTDTSREGQIQNLREVSSRGAKKILLTINGCRCKAFGEKAERILAHYKNGDYTHANGHVETNEYGQDFVITSGYRLEPDSTAASPEGHCELRQSGKSREGKIENLNTFIDGRTGIRQATMAVGDMCCKASGQKAEEILALFKKGDYVHLDGNFEAGECGAINFGIESFRFLDLTENRTE